MENYKRIRNEIIKDHLTIIFRSDLNIKGYFPSHLTCPNVMQRGDL